MKTKLSDQKINYLFLLISFIFLGITIGFGNISLQSVEWLHDGNESAIEQTAWYFFRNDVWRFPLGLNPNYGDDITTSIVFSDSIPILAFFFKIFKSILPENFQYFSLWYFLCFYFQLFFSYKILKKFTDSESYSLIGSIFFLLAPIFIFRMNYHASVSAHWLLLFTLYLALTTKTNESKLPWFFLIIFSSLILYNFTIIILAVYSLLRFFELKFNKSSFYSLIKDFFIIAPSLLLTLYLAGYLEIRIGDTLAVGFGQHKLNLLSIVDPVNTIQNISWSWFLPDIQLSKEEELEGFNYLGTGQIIMLLFALVLILNQKFNSNLSLIKNNKKIKAFLIISIFLTLWSLSNKISFGSYTLLEIPLNKFIFAALSIAKASGRLFWIVNYFLVIISIIIIYKCFSKKTSLLIIFLLLTIQIADISAGLKNKISFYNKETDNIKLKDPIWNELFVKYKVIKTTYPQGYPGIFYNFSYSMEKNKIQKTNLAPQARVNRKVVAEARYTLYKNFNNKKLDPKALYVIGHSSQLKHLKNLFNNEDVAFFYRDNIWFMVMNEKNLMNDKDKEMLNKITPKVLELKKNETLNFEDSSSYHGLGWSHNSSKNGVWSEGNISTLFFKTKENYGNIKLEIFFKPYLTKNKTTKEFDIYVNDKLNKKIELKNKSEENKIEILIDGQQVKNNEVKIDFIFKNLMSPYEALESPDSRKLGILVKNIKLVKI
jgi:hypothetical protein